MGKVDRLSKDNVRQRRAFQRVSGGLYDFGNGLAFDADSSTLSIDIASDAGLEFIAGQLAVEAGDGIVLTSSGVEVDLLTNGGLEFVSGQISIADTIDLSVVGSSSVMTFSGSGAGNGIVVGVTKLGNDATTSTTSVMSHTSHTATPAIAQSSSGDVRIESASGQPIRITPNGTAGIWIGAGSLDLTPAGLGSLIVGGTDPTGNITSTGTNTVAVGAALGGSTISSTGTFFSFAVGVALTGSSISSSNFSSLAMGLTSGASAAISSSGFGSVAGGVGGLGFSNTITVSGNASFGWGAGITITGIAAQAFGEDHTVSARNGTAFGDTNTVSATKGLASGYGADARLTGCRALSNYSENEAGDGQQLDFTLYADTTDATPTNMTLDNSSSRVTIQEDSVVAFSILVVGKEAASGGERAAYRIEGCIYRDTTAGSTTVTGVTTTTIYETTGTMNATATADTTNGALNIQVTGVAATDMRWTAGVRMAEIVAGA